MAIIALWIITVTIGILDIIGIAILCYIAIQRSDEAEKRTEREKSIMLDYREGADYSQYLQNVEPDSEPDTIKE